MDMIKRPPTALLIAGVLILLVGQLLPEAESAAAQSDGSVTIELVVLPPSGSEDVPEEVGQSESFTEASSSSAARSDGPDDSSLEGRGTLTATLSSTEPLPATYSADGFMISLMVDDLRVEGDGWVFNVMQGREGAGEHELLLHHYPGAQLLHRDGAHKEIHDAPVRQLSIGQSLNRMTPVSMADPGIGTGVYGFQFVVACDVTAVYAGVPLVLSLTTAP
jgi:hypothetical protein